MPRRLLIVWALFLVRGTFYCAMLPLWEGWDEYAHFAAVQHWADHLTMPRFDDAMPREVDESMRLAPLAYELRWIGPPYLTHEQWWQLPATERSERLRLLSAMPPAWAREPALHPFTTYQAQQPPLYYWLLAMPLRLAAGWPLLARVFLLRWLSMAIASLAIPLTWSAAANLLGRGNALYAATLLAIAPGFLIDTFRIANDSVAIVAAALLLLLLSTRRSSPVAAGLTLGAALLAKAYLLALIPALILCWWRQKKNLAIALALALLTGGWWYARNLLAGHTLSGWQGHPSGGILSGAFHIDWLAAANITAKTFIWWGAWSFLTLKSWIYVLFEAIAAVGAVLASRRWRELKIPLIFAGFYLIQMAYGTLLFWKAEGVANLPGWYMWPVGGAFAMILAAGLKRATLVLIGLLALLDLYGVIAVMMPYYAGLATRGHVDARLFPEALQRLHTSLPLAALWILATIAIPLIAGWPGPDKPLRNPHRTPLEKA
ncbi:MAG: hypothetical protein ABJC09_07815 [Terriglobia bacterium]